MTGTQIAIICMGGFVACVSTSLAAHYLEKGGFTLPPATGRLGCVDGLRGYLATFVLIYHFILYIDVTRFGGVWSRPNVSFFDSLGPGSVNLFFMTTGFLFYPRIMRGVQSIDWVTLYISRVFRIVPLLIFLVFAASALILIRTDFHPTAPFGRTAFAMVRWILCWDQPDLWGYKNSSQLASVLWSLWFEWLFYIFVLPACAVAMSLRGRAPTYVVPTLLIALSIALRPFHLTPLIDFLPLFGIGMLAFEVKNRPAVASALRGPGATFVAFTCLAAGAVLPSGALRMVLHGMFFISVASGCSLWGVLKTRGSRVMGEVSYGIYVLHMLVLNILFVSFADQISSLGTEALPVLMPIAAFAVLGSAALAFLLIERPGIHVGRAIAKKTGSWLRLWGLVSKVPEPHPSRAPKSELCGDKS